jgi:hypothetical protein
MEIEFTYDVVAYGDDQVVFLIRLANNKDPFEDRFDTIQEVRKALNNNPNDVVYFSSELLREIL